MAVLALCCTDETLDIPKLVFPAWLFGRIHGVDWEDA
jgi:hypothetical protein